MFNPPQQISANGASPVIISGLNIPDGGSYYLQWVYTGVGGSTNGQALGIDDFTLTAIFGIAVKNLTWNPNPGETTWDTDPGNLNWQDETPAASAFADGDAANFTDLGLTNGSSVTVDAGGVAPSAVNVSNTTGVYTIGGGAIGGTGALTKTGDGELVLTGSNTYSGNTIISGGTVQISSDANLGDANGDVVLSGGALRVATDVALNSNRTLSGTGGTLDVADTHTLTLNGAVSLSGPLTLSNTGAVVLGNASNTVAGVTFTAAGTLDAGLNTITVAGNVTASQASGEATIGGTVAFGSAFREITVSNAAATLTIPGNITGTNRLNKLGDGVLDLQGDNSGVTNGFRIGGLASGMIPPAAGGTIRINNKNALGSPNTTLQFNNGSLNAAAALTGADALPGSVSVGAPDSVNGGNGAVFAGSDIEFNGGLSIFKNANFSQYKITVNNTTTFNGPFGASNVVAGSFGLTIGGTGSLVFNDAPNAHDLPIRVDGATVVVNGAFTSPAASFTLVNNGTLRGTGPIAGTVDVGGGVIAPGSSVGEIATGAQTWSAGGTYEWELIDSSGAPGTGFDHISVAGLLSIAATPGGQFIIKLIASSPANFDPSQPQSWRIAQASDGVDAFDALAFLVDRSGFADADPDGFFDVRTSGGGIFLHYVPEPGSGLMVLTIGAWALRRRRGC